LLLTAQRPQDDVEDATGGMPSLAIGANGTVVLSVWHRPACA
jgi:hypothetical protein